MTREHRGNTPSPPLLGAHFSIAGGLEKALGTAAGYGCSALQIFTKNASTWKERTLTDEDIAAFDTARKQTGITEIASHTSYLINLAADDARKRARSREALEQEMIRCRQLGIPYVVLHPGAHMGAGAETGVARIADGINRVMARLPDRGPLLLLEITAGQGSSVGHTFESLADIARQVHPAHRIGFCFDTCHAFAAGYDIRNAEAYQATMGTFDDLLGMDRLRLIHLNDAKKGFNSRVDRHAHIGQGHIGPDGFSLIMNDPRLAKIPKILETPKGKRGDPDFDRINLDRLLAMVR